MQFEEAFQEIISIIDPALAAPLKRELSAKAALAPRLPMAESNVVLVGHRAAGKTRLLPIAAGLIGRRAVDLDEFIQAATGRTVSDWVNEDLGGFRRNERRFFQEIQGPAVVAVGGGFLSSHPDLLKGHLPVLVPITFETYRARLLIDNARPRLKPSVSLEEEIEGVFREREKAHASIPTVSLVDFLRVMRDRSKP